MKIISFVNQKGGVGKTTLSINVAAVLAEQGNKVLLVDNDAQGNSTTTFVKGALEKTLFDVVVSKQDIYDAIRNTGIENLDIVVNNLKYAEASLMLSAEVARELRLKTAIEKANLDYDYMIIDCNPSMDLALINALVITDKIIVPIDASAYSLVGISSLLSFIDTIRILNSKIEVEGFILNNIDRRTSTYKEIASVIENQYPGMLFEQQVGMNSLFSKMQFARETVIDNKNNNAYKEVLNVVKELKQRWQRNQV